MNNEQSVTLLRRNKRTLAEAFRAAGMADVTEQSRAASFGRRIKWAAGLLDITLACQRTSDGTHWYFTADEWDSLTNTNKQRFVARGLRVRALGHSFVLAPSDVKDSEGNSTMAWANAAVGVPDLGQRTMGDLYNDFAGAENTRLILDAVASDSLPTLTSAPAAERASAYRSYRREDGDALDDTSDWHLPGMGVLVVLYRYRTAINEALSRFWGADAQLQTTGYWSSTQNDAGGKWAMDTGSAAITTYTPVSLLRVRPVADEA